APTLLMTAMRDLPRSPAVPGPKAAGEPSRLPIQGVMQALAPPRPAIAPAQEAACGMSTMIGMGTEPLAAGAPARPGASAQPMFLLPVPQPAPAASPGLPKEGEATGRSVGPWNQATPEPVPVGIRRGMVVGASLAVWGIIVAMFVAYWRLGPPSLHASP